MLPPGPFTRQQAEAVTRRYHNIALKMTRAVTSAWWFVTLKVEWSGAWCFEPDAGEGLNRYIRKSGILRASSS
jgi:hypothetical protein